MTVKAIPQAYGSITPYLIVTSAADAIEFYQRAFGAVEIMRMAAPDGKVGHAEIKVGDSIVMLADEYPDMGFSSPQSLGGAGVSIMFYVEDVDAVFKQALNTGAEELRPVIDQFYGDRSGTLKDPFGHVWTIGTHKEDLSPAEIDQRAAEYFKQQSGS